MDAQAEGFIERRLAAKGHVGIRSAGVKTAIRLHTMSYEFGRGRHQIRESLFSLRLRAFA